MAKRELKPAKKPATPAAPPAPPVVSAPTPPPAPPAPPAKPPVVKVDQTKIGIRRAVALLEEAKSKMSCDPAAVAILINQAIEELTT